MSRLNKYLEEMCGKNHDKMKKKKKKKMQEGHNVTFGGYSVMDNILDGITIEELQTVLHSNIPSDKINPNVVMKEFDKLVRAKMVDSKYVLKKITKDLVNDLQKG